DRRAIAGRRRIPHRCGRCRSRCACAARTLCAARYGYQEHERNDDSHEILRGRALIAQTSATSRKLATNELPPYDMNGSLRPVNGRSPITPLTMITTWNPG